VELRIMSTYARQAEVMKTTKELAFEGHLYFLRVHEGKAERYKDFVEARTDASNTLNQLAVIEQAFGQGPVRELIEKNVRRAQEELVRRVVEEATR
jgi:hypothetical protein